MSRKASKVAPATVSNFINHITFVIDRSASMGYSNLSGPVISVFDNLVKHLAKRSVDLDQETRVSVFLFNTNTECVVWDKDVLRMPSLAKLYHSEGGTALMDATGKALTDLRKIPELYGEHAHLVYVLTDGEERDSRIFSASLLSKTIKGLPDNYTVAALVPDSDGKFEAKKFGFPADNIAIWTTSAKGMDEVGSNIREATDNFMSNRARGIRGTTSLFKFDTASVTKTSVKANLDPLNAKDYEILLVRPAQEGMMIRDFVQKMLRSFTYTKGCAYYQLTKKETVQSNKNICIRENSTGKVYTGDTVRDVLGLPDHEIRVEPAQHKQFSFFVQSTSVNRKLVGNTDVIVML